MTQLLARDDLTQDDEEGFGSRFGRLDANVAELNGKTGTLHNHIKELRQMPIRIDAVELRQDEIGGTMHRQTGELARHGAVLDRLLAGQDAQGQRLESVRERLNHHIERTDHRLDKIDANLEWLYKGQQEHGKRLGRIDDDLNRMYGRLTRLESRVDKANEHLSEIDRKFTGQITELNGRVDVLGGQFKDMDGKLDLVLEHLGISGNGSAS